MVNETVVDTIFNMTVDDIWEFRPKLRPYHWINIHPFVICATLNVPQIRMTTTTTSVSLNYLIFKNGRLHKLS